MRCHRLLSGILLVAAAAWCAGCGAGKESSGGSYNNNGGGGGNIGTSGAQDIGQFRKILDEGGIPGENTLDANGFFSEHHTQLPPPDCGQDLCVHGMLAVHRDWVRGDPQAALQLAINTPIDPTEFERPPLNLVVVVDTSGSMDVADKMPYAKQGLHLLIDNMEEGDRLGLVSYDTDVTVISHLEDPQDATSLHEAVNLLYAGGSTNLHDGLLTGMQMAVNAYDPNRQNRVILLSDGMPTTGITEPQPIIDMAVAFISEGVGLTTIGMGTSFNVDLMRGLAERGAGNFYFVEDSEAVEEVFTEELNYFVTPIAFDLQVEVRTGGAYTLGEVVGTRLWNVEGFGGRLSIPAVFLASRTSQEDPPAGPEGRRGGGSAIFIQLNPTPYGQEVDPNQVAEIRMTYVMAGTEEVVEQVIQVTNPNAPEAELEHPYYTHQAMEKNYAMYNIYLGLREATREAVQSHNDAHEVLKRLEETTVRWLELTSDEDIKSDLDLMRQFIENLEARGAGYDPQDPPAYYGCGNSNDPYTHCGDDTVDGPFFGCSAGGRPHATLPWMLLALALLPLAARARRRVRRRVR